MIWRGHVALLLHRSVVVNSGREWLSGLDLVSQKIMPAMAAKSKSPTPAPIPYTSNGSSANAFLAGVVVIRIGIVVALGFRILMEVEPVVEAVEERLEGL